MYLCDSAELNLIYLCLLCDMFYVMLQNSLYWKYNGRMLNTTLSVQNLKVVLVLSLLQVHRLLPGPNLEFTTVIGSGSV